MAFVPGFMAHVVVGLEAVNYNDLGVGIIQVVDPGYRPTQGESAMGKGNVVSFTSPRFRSRAMLLAILTLCGLCGASAAPAPALAQSPMIMRAQTQAVTGAISRQIQQAMRPKLQIRNRAGAISIMEIGADGKMLAMVSADGAVRVWDLDSGRQTERLPVGGQGAVRAVDALMIPMRALPGGATRAMPGAMRKVVVTAGDNGIAVLWDAVTGTEIKRFTGHTGPILAVRLSPDGSLLATAGTDRTARLWDTATGAQKALLSGHGDAVAAVAFSPSGKVVATGSADRTVKLWSATTGQATQGYSGASAPVKAVTFGSGDDQVFAGLADGQVVAWSGSSPQPSRSWSAHSGAITALRSDRSGTLVSAAGGNEVKVWSSSGSRTAEIRDPEGTSLAVGITAAGNRVVSAGSSGQVRVSDGASGRYLAQLVLTSNGWAVTDASGRFDGSERGIDNVAWADGGRVYEMANFSEPYYEPGLLAKTLRGDTAAILTSNAPAVETAGVGVPPTVTLTAASGAQGQPGPSTVTVVGEDQGAGVDQVQLFHNGKAVGKITANTTETRNGKPARVVTFAVTLLPGSNQFKAVASSVQRIDGIPATITVNVAAPEKKATLHVVSIGINQYANSQMTLNYAVADAKSFVDWARQQQSNPTFGKVVVHELYDRQATRAGILGVLASLESAPPEDEVVIYLAGHGENSRGQWFFLPTEFGNTMSLEGVASEGVGTPMFEQALLKMGPQKVFLLIDACKSGTLGKAFAADADRKNIQALSKGAGIHIMAATDKNQLAVELSELGHGAFTWTVLDALKGRADTSPRDGIVRAREVLNYSSEVVPQVAYKYTGMEQVPTTYSRGSDFELSRGR
ncbi:Peptidase C14 caspase domain-containing protein [uncultured Gammaproteobacteria bacterium]